MVQLAAAPPARPRFARTVSSKTDLHPDVSHALGLFVRTPLIYAPAMSDASDCNVFLKLENTQPSGSFKSRGVGHLCHLSYLDHTNKTHLVVSSGGNAALAVAHAARMLRVRATACVHAGTPLGIRQRLRDRGIEVQVADEVGFEFADILAREIAANDPMAVYIPPFDHKAVVEGHASLVQELVPQWPVNFRRADVKPRKPDLIICSVGGGGLLAGVLYGMRQVGWFDVPVLACESEKTASLLASLQSAHTTSPPTHDLASLAKIGANTICSSLGARTVSQTCLDSCLDHPGGVTELVVPEWKAAEVCGQVLADQHFLVEPACAVAMAAFYPPPTELKGEEARRHRRRIIDEAVPSLRDKARPNIVVVACGGSFATLESLQEWGQRFAPGSVEREVPFTVFSEGRTRELHW